MPLPPIPTYPKAVDSDYTLYVAKDTAETRLSADNAAMSEVLEIYPAIGEEVWPDNGFATIGGELFYYDSVEKNDAGKVIKLKGCARNLGGESSKWNAKNTWVRGYVVAERHNQLATAIQKTENFIGIREDSRIQTLDYRIRNLEGLDVLYDDFNCPDVNITWIIADSDPVLGVLAEYRIEITPPGGIGNFRLDFGDGEYTTTELSGTHRYALNATIDPVVKISNEKCQIIQTPIERTNASEPTSELQELFDLPIPEIPNIPDFTFVPCEVPEPEINLPPLVLGCEPSIVLPPIDFSGLNGDTIASAIQTIFGPSGLNIPSFISFVGPNPNGIPSVINIEPAIPPTIIIDPPIPPTIVIVPPISNIIHVFWGTPPTVDVNWGEPPVLQVGYTALSAQSVPSAQNFQLTDTDVEEFGTEFADVFSELNSVKIESEKVGFPTAIQLETPENFAVKLDSSSLDNKTIRIDSTSVAIPESIVIEGPKTPIPNSISLDATVLLSTIERLENIEAIKIDTTDVPKSIKLDTSDVPRTIELVTLNPIPEKIIVESDIPTKITLEAPTGIPIIIPDGFALPIQFPNEMPQVEMVWNGGAIPVEVKITMDDFVGASEEDYPCVMLVPCAKK